MFFMFLVKLRHISAQVKVLFASADNNKKNQLKDSLRDAGKGHLKSLIFSLRQSWAQAGDQDILQPGPNTIQFQPS